MKRYLILYFIISFLSVNCKQSISEDELLTIGITDCRKQPAFIKSTGLQPQRAALSTSEKRIKGLVLIEVPQTVNDTARRTWRHPSWDAFGWMGPITTDEAGNTYLAPVPTINVLDNPSDQQNIIYKVESNTGEMKPFINLADKTSPVTGNPYGLLAASKCFTHTQTLQCITCHNTHQQERGNLALFSTRCMQCHTENSVSFCKMKQLPLSVLEKNCIDCHMPVKKSKMLTVENDNEKNMPATLRSHFISVYPEESKKYMQLMHDKD